MKASQLQHHPRIPSHRQHTWLCKPHMQRVRGATSARLLQQQLMHTWSCDNGGGRGCWRPGLRGSTKRCGRGCRGAKCSRPKHAACASRQRSTLHECDWPVPLLISRAGSGRPAGQCCNHMVVAGQCCCHRLSSPAGAGAVVVANSDVVAAGKLNVDAAGVACSRRWCGNWWSSASSGTRLQPIVCTFLKTAKHEQKHASHPCAKPARRGGGSKPGRWRLPETSSKGSSA